LLLVRAHDSGRLRRASRGSIWKRGGLVCAIYRAGPSTLCWRREVRPARSRGGRRWSGTIVRLLLSCSTLNRVASLLLRCVVGVMVWLLRPALCLGLLLLLLLHSTRESIRLRRWWRRLIMLLGGVCMWGLLHGPISSRL
jgi:hypothetical protein